MHAMPKRDVEDFISHWSDATAPEQSISQQVLCERCELPAELAKQFARAKPADILEILKTLETLGRARRAGEGKFRR